MAARNNPWDLERSPGGSSGGAAAAVATGMSALELGSDLGGSIRWPAHAAGLFGLKPTWGLVSTRGHRPPPPGMDIEADLSVAGPLARSARDLDLALSVIAGPPALDGVKPATRSRRAALGPKGLRVALWADEPFAPVDAYGRRCRRAVPLRCSPGAGAEIDEEARPGFRFEEAFEVYALLNHAIIAAGLPEKMRDRLAAEAASFATGDLSHRALQARGARIDVAALARPAGPPRRAEAGLGRVLPALRRGADAPCPGARHPAPHDRGRPGPPPVVNGIERP